MAAGVLERRAPHPPASGRPRSPETPARACPARSRAELCSRRALARWIAFATRSLPGPDSAAVRFGTSTGATRSTCPKAPASPRSGASGTRSPEARPCLLVAGPVVVENAPRIRDVTALLEGPGQSRLFFVDSLIAMGADRAVRSSPGGGGRPHRAARRPDGVPRHPGRMAQSGRPCAPAGRR